MLWFSSNSFVSYSEWEPQIPLKQMASRNEIPKRFDKTTRDVGLYNASGVIAMYCIASISASFSFNKRFLRNIFNESQIKQNPTFTLQILRTEDIQLVS